MLLHFEERISSINSYLKLIGFSIDSDDSHKTMLQRLRKHWILSIHLFSFNFSIAGQSLWFVQVLFTGTTLWEVTYSIPCLTLCVLGYLKMFCFVRSIHHVNDLIEVLTKLLSNDLGNGEAEEPTKWLKFMFRIDKTDLIIFFFGFITFALGPFVLMGSNYLSTGKFELLLPFLLYYPFDPYDIRFWPFAYIHQMVSAWDAIGAVYGPDCFFFTCCTFIQILFMRLHENLEQIVKKDSRDRFDCTIDTFKTEFVQIVKNHRELMRCVGLLELIYSSSILLNVVSSSMIICAAGFNLMAIENLALMAPFIAFLGFGLLQIYFFCYFGDWIMRSSLGVGDAIYNSRWYEIGVAQRKYLLIALVRSQKPCKLTAYGFTDVNLSAYNRILSSSWSYFALLKQMYHK